MKYKGSVEDKTNVLKQSQDKGDKSRAETTNIGEMWHERPQSEHLGSQVGHEFTVVVNKGTGMSKEK